MRAPKIIFGLGLVVLVVLLLSPQRHPLAYNMAAEVTLQGTVQDVRTFYCPLSGGEGTHLTLATDAGEVQVHVAPARFLSGKLVQFARGDQIEVVGSRIHYLRQNALIARTITRGTETVALRSENGKPLWAE